MLASTFLANHSVFARVILLAVALQQVTFSMLIANQASQNYGMLQQYRIAM